MCIYFVKFVAVPLDKPEISVEKLTCNSVSFLWTQDTKNFVEVKSFDLKVIQDEDRNVVRIKSTSGNTSQEMFSGLEESTKYTLIVKQKTDAEEIGYESSKKIKTYSCMFVEIIFLARGVMKSGGNQAKFSFSYYDVQNPDELA